jgi:hypothetical protein
VSRGRPCGGHGEGKSVQVLQGRHEALETVRVLWATSDGCEALQLRPVLTMFRPSSASCFSFPCFRIGSTPSAVTRRAPIRCRRVREAKCGARRCRCSSRSSAEC